MKVGDLVKAAAPPHVVLTPYTQLMADLYPEPLVGIVVGEVLKTNPPIVKVLTEDGILRYPANSLEVLNEI